MLMVEQVYQLMPNIMKAKSDDEPTRPKAVVPYLPAEIKSITAQYLVKSDLKTLRHVSKDWSAMATPFLFDRIFISPYEKDLQVFTKITQNSVLSGSIKEMIVDTSWVTAMSHECYFHLLLKDIRSLSSGLSEQSPFYGRNRRLNKLVKELMWNYRHDGSLWSKHGNERLVKDGYLSWEQLSRQQRRSLGSEGDKRYYLTLCSGLERLPSLQTVKFDHDIWGRNIIDMSSTISSSRPPDPFHVLRPVYSGSPLSRGWNPWHLRPKRSGDGADNLASLHLHLITRARSATETKIKNFECLSWSYNGLSPCDFCFHEMPSELPQPILDSFSGLMRLELQITPRWYHDIDHGDANPLGLLPQLLHRLTGLKSLSLRLLTAKRLRQRKQFLPPPLNDTCYAYSQVFPSQGVWPRLKSLYLVGLAIDGLDLFFLLVWQMPNLKILWLDRIDLLGSQWEGMIEAMRWVERQWQLLHLQGSFRHKNREWWPYETEGSDGEYDMLQDCSNYIQYGGRHPSLPTASEDSQSLRYWHDMFTETSIERSKAFHNRKTNFQDRYQMR